MREVAIIGIGQTTVAEHWEKSLRELAGEAIFAALAEAQRDRFDGLYVGNMLSGMLSKQEHLGALIADWVGIKGVEAYKVEAACGSGAAALRAALMAVSSGYLDSAVAVGVEKMTDSLPLQTTEALATAADADYESSQGVTFVALNALLMRRYMIEYGWEHTNFAPFSINAHCNGAKNPYARLQDIITQEEYNQARMVADPINLLDASPIGDGAAAVFIVPSASLQPNGTPKVIIAGSSMATDSLAIHDRKDPLWLEGAYQSCKKAVAQAEVDLEEIDLFELHDAFSIMSALSLEACGFAERGQAPRMALEGQIFPGGRLPISTCGGLKARGHPVGATGLYQIVEVVQQLRGEADLNQVDGARIGMAQNIGGSGATVITHILKASGDIQLPHR